MKKEIIGTLIGSQIKVIDSKNKSIINLNGKVIDETKNTIKIQKNNQQIILHKNQIKIKNEN